MTGTTDFTIAGVERIRVDIPFHERCADRMTVRGFTTMKVKARPWHDLDEQLAAVAAAVSPHFKLDADFNEMLLGVDVAAPFIARLEAKYPMLAMVESPIPQGDVAGNAALRRRSAALSPCTSAILRP